MFITKRELLWSKLYSQYEVDFLLLLVLYSQNKKPHLSGQAAVVNTEPVEVRPTAEANTIKRLQIKKALHQIIYRAFTFIKYSFCVAKITGNDTLSKEIKKVMGKQL